MYAAIKVLAKFVFICVFYSLIIVGAIESGLGGLLVLGLIVANTYGVAVYFIFKLKNKSKKVFNILFFLLLLIFSLNVLFILYVFFYPIEAVNN